MAKQDAAALRAARQKRIASRTKGTQSNPATKTAAPTEKAPATAPSVLTAAVLDPQSVTKTAEIDLIGYGQAQDPFWVVLANGRPVAEIRLSDQEDPSGIAKLFVGEQYAAGVREAAKQFPFSEVLEGVRACPYQASVATDDAYRTIEAKLTEKHDVALREAKANVRDDMSNMLNLVVLAQNKNFLRENPLKDELFRRMASAGIEDSRAIALIEGAFQARAPEHFEICFKQAMKWMDLTPQALGELEEQIKDLGYRQPVAAASDEIRAASAAAPSGSHNVPLYTRTAGSNAASSEKEDMRAAMGFGRRQN